MKYKLLVDIHSNRVVYFTANISEHTEIDDNLYICYLDDELPSKPKQMTQFNAWSWKWNSIKNELFFADAVNTTKETLFDQNKKAAFNTLLNVVNTARTSLYSQYKFDDVVNNFIFRELFLDEDKQTYLTTIASIRGVDASVVRSEFEAKRKKIEDILFLTEVTKQLFTKQIQDAKTSDELYEIRNNIAATDILQQYKKMI